MLISLIMLIRYPTTCDSAIQHIRDALLFSASSAKRVSFWKRISEDLGHSDLPLARCSLFILFCTFPKAFRLSDSAKIRESLRCSTKVLSLSQDARDISTPHEDTKSVLTLNTGICYAVKVILRLQ